MSDGGIEYFQTLGLQEQFNEIFGEQYGCDGNAEKAVPAKRNIMEGWSDKRKEEWRQA